MKRILVLVSVIAALAISGTAMASPQMEKMRETLKQSAVTRHAKLQTYPNARQLQRRFDAECGSITQDIERAHAASFCAAGCPNTAANYALALRKVNETRLRMAADYPVTLKACVTIAMARDDDRSSYAMAVMLRAMDRSEETEWTALWASSSLALGKGVPKSRNDAIKALQEITRPDMRPEMRNVVLSLANSLFGF
jgi:hypothetical protein